MSYKKLVGAIVGAGLLCTATQIIFAETITTSTSAAPIISNLRVENIIGSGAQVKWTTDQLSDSAGVYHLYPNGALIYLTLNNRCDSGGAVTLHCVNLTNLLPGSTYNYRVESHNSAGVSASSYGNFISALQNVATSGLAPAATTTLTSSTTSPTATVSNTTVSETTDTTTTSPATTTIATSALTTETTSTDPITAVATTTAVSTATTTSITPATTTATQAATSTTLATVTAAVLPIISNVRTENISSSGAQIKWTTDQLSGSVVAYMVDSNGVVLYSYDRCDSTELVFQHCINLTSLHSGSKYYFRIESQNEASLTAKEYGYFFTLIEAAEHSDAQAATSSKVAETHTVTTIQESAATSVPPVATVENSFRAQLKQSSPRANATGKGITTAKVVTSTGVGVPEVGSLKSKVTLKGSGNVIDGEEVYVKVNQMVSSIEMHLSRKDSNESLYLGQAQFDTAGARWVFRWDSTQTPDGQYVLFPLITTSADTGVHGEEKMVIVKNEKGTGAARPQENVHTTSIKPDALAVDTTSVSGEQVPGGADTLPVIAMEPEKFIEQIKKEKQQEEQQIKKEITDTLVAHLESVGNQATNPGFKEETAKKIEELKIAINEGDTAKKNEIINNIVNTTAAVAGVSGGAAQDVLVKKIEESTAKLEQVATEQKTGVVDVKNFSVDAVRVAEVATKPDGTQVASKIEFKGKALPNSFATIYIFSIPVVVTVRTDKDGYWNYTLDKELENGKHQVYVAITDVKGAVVAKSNLLPFVKEASAITLDQVALAPIQQDAPSFVGTNYFYMSIIVIVFIVGLMLLLIGLKTKDTPQL